MQLRLFFKKFLLFKQYSRKFICLQASKPMVDLMINIVDVYTLKHNNDLNVLQPCQRFCGDQW